MVDKAEQQNAIRREQKRKQKAGRGKRRKSNEVEAVRLSRHVQGDWSPETKTLLSSTMMESGRLATTRSIVDLMLRDKLSVMVKDEDNLLVNDKVFFVTREGFKDEDGDRPNFEFYSVTVPTGSGFGVQMRWDKSQRMFIN